MGTPPARANWRFAMLHKCFSMVLSTAIVVVVGYPTPSDGGMAEDHGAPEAGQLPRGVPGVTGTLGKANSHFDSTQTGSGTAPPR